MAANSSFPQLGEQSVQVDTEERRREDCTLANSILHSEAGAFHRVPSDEAGLVQVNAQDQAQDDWWEFSFNQFLKQLLKINFIKSF